MILNTSVPSFVPHVSPNSPRIALIHALFESIAPINAALREQWPEARSMNLLDDSLSADIAELSRGGSEFSKAQNSLTHRLMLLADYARDSGAVAILFSCSAFGACIDAVKAAHADLLVLKPNEAMIEEASDSARTPHPVGLITSFAPTLVSMPNEFPAGVLQRCVLAEGALTALQAGDAKQHDALVMRSARQLAKTGCRSIALAQFSLAHVAPAIRAECGLPVLTTPGSAVSAMRNAFYV